MKPKRQKAGGSWLKVALFFLVALATGVAVGKWILGGDSGAGKAWKSADELQQLYSTPDGFNVVESNKAYEVELMSLYHDKLYNYDPVQNQLVPALAKGYEVSKDGKTWTFHLRPAETPDGTRLTADDVVFSVNLCLDTRFNCKRRGNLTAGGKPVQVATAGPLVVTFSLAEPYPSFLWAISEVLIVPKSVYEPISGGSNADMLRKALNTQRPDAQFLSGFGPYKVEKVDTQEIRLERNERFWGRGDNENPKPRLKRIVLSLRKTGAPLDMDFRSNPILTYRLVGPGEAEQLREDTRFQVLDRGLSGWSMFWWVNQNPKAPWAKNAPARLALFRKQEFRRALARAIDRDEIIRRVFGGYAEPLYGPVSPAYLWATKSETLKDQTPQANTGAALAELAKLGVTPGEPGEGGVHWLTYDEEGKRVRLEIELRTSQSEEDLRKKSAEVIAEQLRRIGLRVKVVEESFRDIVKRVDETFDYEAALMFLEGSPNAATAKSMFMSSGDMHFFHPYQSSPGAPWEAKVDKAYERFAAESDPVKQQEALNEVQDVWVEAQPVFYLLNDRKLVAIRRDFEVNGVALTGRAADPILTRTVIENVRQRVLSAK